jgi:hypothetical protein
MGWYSVKCIFVDEDDNSEYLYRYKERILLWEANNSEEAISYAETEAKEYSINNNCEYLEFCNSCLLFEKPNVGKELYSISRESDLEPQEYLDEFYDTGAECTGILDPLDELENLIDYRDVLAEATKENEIKIKRLEKIARDYSAEIIDYGIYSDDKKGKEVQDRFGSKSTEVDNVELLEQTDVIQGGAGLMFGIRYIIHGPVNEEAIEALNKVYFPEPILDDREWRMESEFHFSTITGSQSISMFYFDDDDEIKEGKFIFEVNYNGVSLLRKEFNVKKKLGESKVSQAGQSTC